MSEIIKNVHELATSPQRRDALAIVEAGLQAIDTVAVLQNSIVVEDDTLVIQGQHFALRDYEHIYIIGFGKVSCTAAHTLEKILAGRVKEGAVIGLSEKVCQVVETYAGTHPRSSQQNYVATKHIAEVARKAKENDLVIVVVSGGGSALLCSTMAECDQGNQLFESFLVSGGTIEELNVVRKHISQLKGGGLAKALYPATVVGLVFSDVPGGDMSAVASGPTCFDTSTVQDAQNIISQYNLGDFHLTETPKDHKYFEKVHNFTIVSNVTALNAMEREAGERGYRASVVGSTQYTDAAETKALLLQEARSGLVACMGGETKVVVPKDVTGEGGRNGHLALSLLSDLKDTQVFISLASDGYDNCVAAGAIADKEISVRATQAGVVANDYLEAFDSFTFFQRVGGSIHTGKLESNVSDLMLLLTAQDDIVHESITDVSAVVIQDSRKVPTIEVTVTAGIYTGTFSVPSGASTGEREVAVLAASKAVQVITQKIKPALCGMSVLNQTAIDACLHELDGTTQFSQIGGNTALGVSVAACKAAAAVKGVEVWQRVAELFEYKEQAAAPRLFVNLINGGKHAKYGSDIQEHQIIPDTDDVHAAFAAAKVIQRELYEVLHETYSSKDISIGDEGGYVIPSQSVTEPFEHITQAIKRAQTKVPVLLGADIAASSFYKNDTYSLGAKTYTPAELLEVYRSLHTSFPLLQMVEDPYQEHSFADFAAYKNAHPGVLTIGDDLTTTNTSLLQQAIDAEAINALIIKPNQIGTLSDTLETMSVAYANKVWCIVSHRSGETMDDFVADLAFGTKCYGLKAGAPDKVERAVKYNRLLKIQPKHTL